MSDCTNEPTLTLWGTPHSLYTGKVRSYLIKKRLQFSESLPSNPRFQSHILPVVRMMVVPVLEFPDGETVQDSADIIELLEARYPGNPMLPATPVQAFVAHLLDAFGSEGMLAPAMHYRWSFRSEQEHFLRAEFGRAVHAGPNREERLAAGAALMDYFNSTLPFLGVTPESIPAIEAAYEDLLDALDIHFQHHPYILGGRPSIADFGLMAPLFAHLARDPVPASLMKNRAPNVFRWTERMNLANIADGEFPGHAETYPADDAIPATLEPVLALVFRDWGPQWLADAELFNRWVAENPGLPVGHPVGIEEGRKVHATLGMVTSRLRDTPLVRASAPHGLWLLDKALGAATAMNTEAAGRLGELLTRTGGEQVLAIRLARRLQRADYVLALD